MKLVRYLSAAGDGVGVAEEGPNGVTVRRTPWSSFEEIFALPEPMVAVLDFDAAAAPEVGEHRRLPPTVDRAQIIATGGNYATHGAESSHVATFSEPIFFPFLWSAVIGPDDDIVIPAPDTFTDYEVELSFVVGKTAKRVNPDTAMEHVFGYTLVNDVSAREVSMREKMQFMLAKSPDTFVPVGPWVVTRDEVENLYDLEIYSKLNGQMRQRAVTGDMTVRIPELLTFLTETITLAPGTIVTTGTPGGVGFFRDPPESMKPGDRIEVGVSGIGSMENRVVQGW